MSRKTKRAMLFLALITVFTFIPHLKADADTYEIFSFTAYNGAAGIEYLDNQGNVVIYASFLSGIVSQCPVTVSTCYGVFQPFGSFYLTDTLPGLDYTGIVQTYICCGSQTLTNNGYQVSYDTATRVLTGGPIGNLSTIASAALAGRFAINDYGDIAWEDGVYDENFLAYDITSHQLPEPPAFALLLTGLLSLAVIARRGLASPSF
jgi:hypothetical protein